MQTIIDDIWQFDKPGNAIVIPGNIGWTKKGENVMGAGVAKQAAQRYPGITQYFGKECQKFRELTNILNYNLPNKAELLFFPVKPLNSYFPYLSWKNNASLELIERSCKGLLSFVSGQTYAKEYYDNLNVFLPVVGCGNGGLDIKDVYPILEKYLPEDRYHLVVTKYDIKHIEYFRLLGKVLENG